MKFHNCQNGIYMEKSNAVFTKPVFFSNISQIGLHANKNSNVYHYGLTNTASATGSFVVNNAVIGIQVANNSSFEAQNARLNDVRYGLVGIRNSSAKISDSTVQAKTSSYESVGIYADSLASISAFGVSCTGFGSGVSSTGNSQYRVFNKAILFVESTTAQSMVANGSSAQNQDGTIIVDPTRGSGILSLAQGQYSYAGGGSSNPILDL